MIITTSGSPIAGEIYTLECSVSGTSDPATFQWLEGPPDNRTQLTGDAINSNSSVSQLRFSTLMASHGGLYTCKATVGSVVVERTVTLEVSRKYMYVLYSVMALFSKD